MAWRPVYKEMEQLIENKDYFEAQRVYLAYKWSDQPLRYQENLVRAWLYYKPYIEKISKMEIKKLPKKRVSKLKKKFLKELMRSSPNNYPSLKKLENKDAVEREFYNEIHKLVSQQRNLEWLSNLSDRDKEITISHLTKGKKSWGEKYEENVQNLIQTYGKPCNQCEKHIGNIYETSKLPKLPVQNCEKERCYCRYDYPGSMDQFVISIQQNDEKEHLKIDMNDTTFIVPYDQDLETSPVNERSTFLEYEGFQKNPDDQIYVYIFGRKYPILLEELKKRKIKIHPKLILELKGEKSTERDLSDFLNYKKFTMMYEIGDQTYYQEFNIVILD